MASGCAILSLVLKLIYDEALANEAEEIEKMTGISPGESRALIKAKIEARYPSPA
jgi:hypothetical protein